MPFFNLIGYMDDGDLSRAVVQLMRDEWLSVETRNAQGLLSGLGAALSAAAGPGSRDVILTFANSGYGAEQWLEELQSMSHEELEALAAASADVADKANGHGAAPLRPSRSEFEEDL